MLVLQARPLGVQLPQLPQICAAPSTQRSSQATWQQKGSAAHTFATQGLQAGLRRSPVSHSPWLHVAAPQKPLSHTSAQQGVCGSQATPSGTQAGPHTPPLQPPEQQSAGA